MKKKRISCKKEDS